MMHDLLVERLEAPPGVRRYRLWGEIDRSSSPRLTATLIERPASTVEVDLLGVTFIDRTGVSTLVQVKNQLESGGGRLVVLNPSSWLQKVFRLYKAWELVG